MNNKKLIALVAFVTLGAVTLFILKYPSDEPETSTQTAISQELMPHKQASSIVKPSQVTTEPTNVEYDDSPLIEDITSSQDLKLIAVRHEQVLQYPSYSQPILGENSPYLDWNHFEEVPVPVLDGKDTATLSLTKYRHFFPDDIEVNLKSSSNIVTASLNVEDIEQQKTLATFTMEETGWRISPKPDWPEELRLVAHITFEQGEDVITTDLRLFHSVASIVNVGSGTPKNTDMIIPITLQIDKAGIYRVRGNLYQSNGSAIASLVHKQRLSEGEQTIELKAFHKVLLKGKTDYELRDIMIERMSGFPGEKAQYGQSESEVYPIGAFDSGLLSDEPYEMSDKEKQQLEFLHQASN